MPVLHRRCGCHPPQHAAAHPPTHASRAVPTRPTHPSRPLSCSADADFSCFADLALTSPVDYFKEGQGSLMQVRELD